MKKTEIMKNITKPKKEILSDAEAKSLVVYYYIVQEDRKRFYNQERTLDSKDKIKNSFLAELAERALKTEEDIAKSLDSYTKNHVIGKWIRSVHGIGPVLAAGILSYIDITKVNHAGSIWVYAGINAEAKWNKGERRPWNQNLKNLSWKLGDSFNKHQNNENCYYGHIYKKRREEEWRKNLAGEFSIQATRAITEKKYKEYTTAFQWYSGQFNDIFITEKKEYKGVIDSDKGETFPMLPPAHIMARASRYAVKRFYSDLYVVWYEEQHKKKAPLPYVIVSPNFPEHTTHVQPFNYASPY